MKKLIISYLAFAMVFAVSCKKTTEEIVPAVKSDYFQLKVGNYWIYEGYQIDSTGVATSTGISDSAYIEKDTMTGGNRYFKLIEAPFIFSPLQYTIFLRDSSGYLVDKSGRVLASDFNFSDTLQFDTAHPSLYTGYLTMTGKDSLVKMAGGIELPSITAQYKIVPAPVYAGSMPVRYAYEVYARGIGKMKTHNFFFFTGYKSSFERRLLRYNVQ